MNDTKINTNGQQIIAPNVAHAIYNYFILDEESKAVKIGWATNPYQRLEALQTSNPHQLVFLLIIKGSKELETQLHKLFSEDKIRGEWFHYSKNIKEYIASKLSDNINFDDKSIRRTYHINKSNQQFLDYLRSSIKELQFMSKSRLFNLCIELGLSKIKEQMADNKSLNFKQLNKLFDEIKKENIPPSNEEPI
jgi:ribosome-associated translation inhibitor RaiA